MGMGKKKDTQKGTRNITKLQFVILMHDNLQAFFGLLAVKQTIMK